MLKFLVGHINIVALRNGNTVVGAFLSVHKIQLSHPANTDESSLSNDLAR